MNRTMMRRAAAGVATLGMLMVGFATLAPAVSASPAGYVPEGPGPYANTFAAQSALKPQCPQAIADTPGSDPSTKTLNAALNTSTSFEVGGTVHYVYSDNSDVPVSNFTVQDCEVVYPAGFFPAGSIDPATGLVTGTFTKKQLDSGTELDGADLTGFPNSSKAMYFGWVVTGVTPGQFVCNFARDNSNQHQGSGNRKAQPVCFEVTGPNLGIVKTADATPVNAGSQVGFTVHVTNTGTGPATDVSVTDPLPSLSGVSWTIASQTAHACTLTGTVSQSLGCTIGTLAAGGSYDVHITSPTSQGVTGSLPNTATVTSTNAPSAHSTATIVVQAPGLTITKKADASPVNAGSPVGFTVHVGNAGGVAATSVVVTDPLPALTGVSWSIVSQSGSACSIAGAAPSQSLGCSLASLAGGASYDVHITSATTSATSGRLPNTATVSASQVPDGQSSASITVQAPQLAITKTADSSPVNAGSAVGFVIHVANSGAGDATGVAVTDPLPALTGVSWSIASQTGAACSVAGTAPSQSVGCTIGTLAAGTSYDVHITSGTTSATAGTLPNTATVTATNAPSTHSSATVVVNPPAPQPPCTTCGTSTAPDLSVVKVGPSHAKVGDSVTYTMTVTNTGTAPTSNPVTVTDTLDPNTAFTSGGPGCVASSNVVTCTLTAPIGVGASASVSVTVLVLPNTTASSVTDTATVASSGISNDPDDSSSATTTIDKVEATGGTQAPSVTPPAVVVPPVVTPPVVTPPAAPVVVPKATLPIAVLPETASRSLPFTGTNVRLLLIAGLGLLLLGLGLVAGTWRMPRARHYR